MPDEASGRTAFVLAGGGSFGAVQVGMLRELVLSGVRADLVVGCSVGAIGDDDYIDGRVASNTPVETARELGATRMVVLPGGFACALASPPSGAVASAMHALNLMIARQMITDIERIGDRIEIAVVPPLCPLEVSPYDFTRAGELIDRAAASTRQWIDTGGLARREVPHQLRHHLHKQKPR